MKEYFQLKNCYRISTVSLGLSLLLSLLVPTTSFAAEAAGSDYQIQPEDVLEIFVWREEDLQKQVTVGPDGNVSLPLVGSVTAMGKTTEALRADITTRLQEYIPDAVVTVSIVELNGLRIYVTGKVNEPGQFAIGRYVDVLQALTLAGGLTPFADARNIRIIRRRGDREVIYRFNHRQVSKGKRLEQNILLQPNDTVVVP